MTVLAYIRAASTALLNRVGLSRELDEEIRSHIQMHADDLERSGLSREEAERQARVAFGGRERFKQECRSATGVGFLESLAQDIHFGLRLLRKSPGFTSFAILTLALGIGANTAIFSVVNAVLLRSIPVRHPEQLVVVWHKPPQKSFPGFSIFAVSPANFVDWRAQNHVFEDMAIFRPSSSNLTGTANPESVLGANVSANFLSVLGVQPADGRTFTEQEDEPGNGQVVIIGDSFADIHFGGARNSLGKTIELDNQSCLIVGVMPPAFDFPSHAQFWKPLAWSDEQRAVRGNHNYTVVARLRHGMAIAQAQAEMDTISARLAKQYPIDDAGWGAVVVPLREQLVGSLQPVLLTLLGAVGFVLLIACANVANLTLAKACSRRKEIAIRTALGASQARVIRQVLSEMMLLSIAGGIAAVGLAHFIMRAIDLYIGDQLPFFAHIALDGWVLVFTFVITLITGLFAGLAPSWHLTGTDLNASLKQGLGKTDADSGRGWLRSSFVVAQVAISVVLLAGAGLMIRTLLSLGKVDLGIDPHNVVTIPLGISKAKYATKESQANFYTNVIQRISGLPGVESAAAVDNLPLQGGSTQPVQVEGQPVVSMADQPEVPVRKITPGYLEAMRIPLLQGRAFTRADRADSERVVLVSEAFARRFWPGQNPLGRHVALTFDDDTPDHSREVVGVIGNVRLRGLVSPADEAVYIVMPQDPLTTRMYMTVRASLDAASVLPEIALAVHKVDPDVPVAGALTMQEVVDQNATQTRFSMLLLAAFAGLALLLAAVGIYGVESYVTRQKTHDIGIRVALGAQRSNIFLGVIGDGLRRASLGIGIGMVGALLLTRLIRSQLYGLTATDPITYGAVFVVLTVVLVVACYIPAHRAMRVDPMVALRHE